MTFYLTCLQCYQRFAVKEDVTIAQVLSPPTTAAPGSFAWTAMLDMSVTSGSKVYVLNMLQYDSDSISYFFIDLTPCKWIVFTVTQ